MNDDISVIDRLARVDDAQLAPLAEHQCVEDLFGDITRAPHAMRLGWPPSDPALRGGVAGRWRPRVVPLGVAAVAAAAGVVVLVLGLMAVLGPAENGSPTAAKTPRWRLTGDVSGWTATANAVSPETGGLSCPDASDCYVVGPSGAATGFDSVYASHDGGASWSGPLVLPTGIRFSTALDCVGHQDCVAGGSKPNTGAGTSTSVFLQTTDGGQSWQQAPVPGDGGLLATVSCLSPEVCFGLADKSSVTFALGLAPQYGNTASPTTFLATTDGGQTWSQTTLPTQDTIGLLDCTSTTFCVAAGVQFPGTSSVTASPGGVVLVTDDGGRSWAASSLPGLGAPAALACPGAAECFVAGTESERVPISSVTGTGCINILSMGRAATCPGGPTTVVRTSELYRSTAGGMTWTVDPLPTSPPDIMLDNISCPTATQCWASGTDEVRHTETTPTETLSVPTSSIVLTTQDGGGSWAAAALPDVPTSAVTSEMLANLRCPAPDDCVALTFSFDSSGHPLVFTYGGASSG